MRIDIVTIFPEFFSVLDVSLLGKARQSGILELAVHDLRDFTHDRHRTVDDTPYGGGAGMVMKPEPWGEALDGILDSVPEPGQSRPSVRIGSPDAVIANRPSHMIDRLLHAGIDRDPDVDDGFRALCKRIRGLRSAQLRDSLSGSHHRGGFVTQPREQHEQRSFCEPQVRENPFERPRCVCAS